MEYPMPRKGFRHRIACLLFGHKVAPEALLYPKNSHFLLVVTSLKDQPQMQMNSFYEICGRCHEIALGGMLISRRHEIALGEISTGPKTKEPSRG